MLLKQGQKIKKKPKKIRIITVFSAKFQRKRAQQNCEKEGANR